MDYIEHLEIENFKSYKGHQLVGPFKEFTAIIGANGAGKSNLMDAISFVFGVHTSTLRGTQLLDLVYKFPEEGGNARRVRGYVKLVLVRTGDKKITFQRSILDSGGSEYSIDGLIVRWEEYESCLNELNINVKAKNFLVFQGGVERIAQKSPKELTELIEQVSGSHEFRAEYERLAIDRDKAMENVQFIFKKQKGMRAEKKQYKEQCREADVYNELKDRYCQLQMQQVLFQLFYIGKDIELLSRERQKGRDELASIREKQNKVEKVLEKKRKSLAENQQALAKVKREMDVKKLQIEKYGLSVIRMQKELEHLDRRKESNRQKLNALYDLQRRHQEKVESLEKELEELEAEEKRYNEQEERLQRSTKDVNLSKDELEEWYRVKDEAKLKTAAERDLLSREERLQEADESLLSQKYEAEMEDCRGRLRVLEEQRVALVQKREQLCRLGDEAAGELESMRRELERVKQESMATCERQRELENQLKEVQDKLREMRVDVSEADRRNQMEECLSTLQRLFSGVYGRVFDLVNPSAPKYKVALTVVLGSNMDSIVVSSEKVAIECIKYMREQRVGIATFLPLDGIKAVRVDERLRTLHPEVKPMVDVLDYEPQYQRAVEYVCGNTLVCAELDLARKLAFEQPQRHKVVTCDGTMITKSGLMTGGISGVEARAHRWDSKEVVQMKSRRDQLISSLSEVTQAISTARYQHLQSTVSKQESKLRSLQLEKELTENRLQKLEESIRMLEGSISQLHPEYEKLCLVVNERRRKIESMRASILRIEDELFDAFSKKVGVDHIREWDESRKHRMMQQAETRLRFASQRSRINNLIEYERQRDEGQGIQDLERRMKEDEELCAKTLGEINMAQDQLNKLQDVSSLRQKYSELQRQASELENELKSLHRDYEVRQKLYNQVAKRVDSKDAAIYQHKERRHQIYKSSILDGVELPVVRGIEYLPDISGGSSAAMGELTTSATNTESQSARDTLSSEDRIEVSFTPHLSKKLMSLQTLSQRDEQEALFLEQLHNLSVQIDKIAPNMKATEHLEEANKRIEKMDQAFEEAKAQVRDLISRFETVREQRNERFMKAFHCISSQIDTVYKGLTNQFGIAHLTLDSNDEPYLHATRFSAVPPYKMYHDIGDLSGGEKSVAALALLFAIHSFRPSPFFILDEVDAALDHTNVKIVAQYFKAQSERLQLIVISLKDRCFEHADALIGVYIDRSAEDSSKIITLDLTKYDP
ncbi:uncharacterized protein LOC126323906 [Schistocerca gregaria]|uniref:uncharacterized protein LOC126323906 n=1 Tax=Schistocerca gregaria TaxID=7010 RepID=UPI00211E7E7F|nr:uncharacterized protein LOC126323906 [Schistocerca gregaria]